MIALWLALAVAHPLQTPVLRVVEGPEGVVATWRTAADGAAVDAPSPILPCAPQGEPEVLRRGAALELRWELGCSTALGEEAGVDGLAPGGQALVDYRLPGAGRLVLVDADFPTMELAPGSARRSGDFREAMAAGFWHLLGGLDHVLLVLGLLVAVPARRIPLALAGLTAGHGASVGLVGGGLVRLPQGALEVGMALSLVWLAAATLRPQPTGLGPRAGWLCLGLGVLHGLGFAGSWLVAGLDHGQHIRGLLGFNLGIGLAQLGVAAVALAAVDWVGRPPERAIRAAVWLGGAAAAMWVWERLLVGI